MAATQSLEEGKTVLLVEDDKDIREVLCEVLESEGIKVTAVSNGQEGLDYLRSSPAPALVLLDLMMPVKDGLQFRSEQLGDVHLSKVPVVLMSAGNNLPKAAEKAQIGEHLKKPVELETLIDMVKKYVEK